MRTRTLCLPLLLTLSSLAGAQRADSEEHGPRQQLLALYDSNGDGQLDKGERRQARRKLSHQKQQLKQEAKGLESRSKRERGKRKVEPRERRERARPGDAGKHGAGARTERGRARERERVEPRRIQSPEMRIRRLKQIHAVPDSSRSSRSAGKRGGGKAQRGKAGDRFKREAAGKRKFKRKGGPSKR